MDALYSTLNIRSELLPADERILLSYSRALAVLQVCNLSVSDVRDCTRRFVDMHKHPIMALDAGCTNIIACHVNLFLGVITSVKDRPDLLPLAERGLRGGLIGNFLLTEVGHGLDITALETTATKVDDGFILHTPTESAAKFMPPTTPHPEVPKMAIVYARLIVDGQQRGVHPFLVPTSDAGRMHPGVSSTLLPPRGGNSPLDFALTKFDHVKLPAGAFLGSTLEPRGDHRALLNGYVSRLIVGQVCVPMAIITGMKIAACIGVDYSFRRHVQDSASRPFPIISFRTQQLPMLQAVAIAYVLDAWEKDVFRMFTASNSSASARQAIAVIFKTTVCRLVLKSLYEVGERLGAQGVFNHNVISRFEADARGMVIAEGDLTAISIRFFSQLLQTPSQLPRSGHEDSLLARHAAGVMALCLKLLKSMPAGHRDPQFNGFILPQCERGTVALGCGYAYASALDAGVPQPLLDLFECAAIRVDPAWYAEYADLGEERRLMKEDAAVRSAMPHIREYVDTLNVRHVCSTPITSDRAWSDWVAQLKCYRTQMVDGVLTLERGSNGDAMGPARARL